MALTIRLIRRVRAASPTDSLGSGRSTVYRPDASASGSVLREARAGLGEDQERALSSHSDLGKSPVRRTLPGNANILRGIEKRRACVQDDR